MPDADNTLFDPAAPIYGLIEGAVGHLVLNRVDRRNAMTQAMWARVPPIMARLTGETDVRLLVIRSADPAVFSAGADIAELQALRDDRARREASFHAIQAAQRAVRSANKPVLAVIGGPCVGAGCGLALSADIRLAHRDARLGITPARLGLVYPMEDVARLAALVGPARAADLLYTGRLVAADDGREMGLVDWVAGGALAPAMAERIATLTAGSLYSQMATKRMLRRVEAGARQDDPETMRWFLDAFDGEDATEGISAFLDKRAPSFPYRS
ncbi:enoyl-CoA hydratase/isomerase family protein [Yunchengibacter salinarum]|uniref:enoyl-CoA hydratase/isomerase family protein n=1 Tax=Yunchengibacter salinarum TaxID=3133399 RepID=UPI0035B5808D